MTELRNFTPRLFAVSAFTSFYEGIKSPRMNYLIMECSGMSGLILTTIGLFIEHQPRAPSTRLMATTVIGGCWTGVFLADKVREATKEFFKRTFS